jgi:leucyl/phenylalanyl-tRNA--protein transferase
MKEIIDFPDPQYASEEGLVYLGGSVNAQNLICAYKKGIFPWPMQENAPMVWCSPDPRGVIFLKYFHLPKSLKKFLKTSPYKITKNKNFTEVITLCGQTRPETWITSSLLSGYQELFQVGKAYSIESWYQGELVGGLYGVNIGNFYSAESMFFLKDNASKVCLVYLLNELIQQSVQWIDIQMVTPLSASFGGIEISRTDFLGILSHCVF